jgi:hypothetical protein
MEKYSRLRDYRIPKPFAARHSVIRETVSSKLIENYFYILLRILELYLPVLMERKSAERCRHRSV